MPKSWIFAIPKERLVAVLAAAGLDTSGSPDDLRKRMSRYIDDHPGEFASDGGEPSNPPATPHLTVSPPTLTANAMVTAPPDDAKVMHQIRKWGCHFDGGDPSPSSSESKNSTLAITIRGSYY